jgi:hypothetical protein
MSTGKLVGRSTAGTGIMEEISIGTGLTLSSGILSNSATYTSPLTTKGDIFVRNSTVDTRLPIGLDTQVLIADSTQTTGIKWGSNTAATPTGYYGAWQDDFTQTAAVDNTGYAMKFHTADITPNGISIVNNGSGDPTRITFANTGIYNIQFSSQFQNADNAQHDVNIWLRLNGSDVAGSNGLVSIPARKAAGAGNEGHVITGWNYVLSVVAGQYYELYWMTSNHTNVTMQYYAAGSPPPSAASVILTVTQQSGIMAGTGITAINSLTGAAQALSVGTSGTDFAISSTGTTHTFNLPTASATRRGALSTSDWTTFNGKQDALSGTGFVKISGTTISYDNSTYLTGNQSITLSGDVSGTGSTAITTTIGAGAVTLAKMANLVTGTIIGNNSGSTGVPLPLTSAQVTVMLSQFSTTTSTQGVVPGSSGLGATYFLNAAGAWAVPAGGGASDYLSALTGAEIAIATTATATISRQHLISGTTADYIVTLPAASGNTGKFIGIRISTSATRFFTIKGNASELIDGVNTRIMWKGETAILYCDGTGWKKMAGLSIPMSCQMYQTSVNTTLFLNNTDTKVPITGIKVNNTGLMANTGSSRIDIKRTGTYSLKGAVSYNNFSVNSPRALTQLRVNASGVCNSDCSALIGSYATPFATTDLTLNLNDYVELWGLQTSGVTQGVWGNATLVATMILATEITTW